MTQTVQSVRPNQSIPIVRGGFRATAKDAWEHFAPIYDLAPMQTTKKTSLFVNQSWIVSGMFFGEHALEANVVDHASKHMADTEHLIIAHRYVRGYSHGVSGGKPFSTLPGMVAIRDYSKPFKAYQSPCISQGVYFPRELIGYDARNDDPPFALGAKATITRVLNAEFDYIYDQFKSGAPSVDAARLKRLIACFSVAYKGENSSQDVRALAREALGDVIREFIEDNLGSPRLSTTLLLKEFGVSRATLYRIFEMDGGVRNYISTRRLVRSAIDLARRPTRRGEIARTAERWGFSSPANFNRAVKDYFGVKPGSMFQHSISQLEEKWHSQARSLALSKSKLWAHRV